MLDGRVLGASQVEYKPFGKPPLKREPLHSEDGFRIPQRPRTRTRALRGGTKGTAEPALLRIPPSACPRCDRCLPSCHASQRLPGLHSFASACWSTAASASCTEFRLAVGHVHPGQALHERAGLQQAGGRVLDDPHQGVKDAMILRWCARWTWRCWSPATSRTTGPRGWTWWHDRLPEALSGGPSCKGFKV